MYVPSNALCLFCVLTEVVQSDSLQGTNEVLYYNGFLMANNCGIIAQNGETEDPNQVRASTLEKVLEKVSDSRPADVQGWVRQRCCRVLQWRKPVRLIHRSVRLRGSNSHSLVFPFSPNQAKDTQGHWWNCSPTSDTSCNKYLGYGSYYVTSCCSRQ